MLTITISTIIKLRNSNELTSVNLSWVWKVGLIVLAIGVSVLIFNFNNIYANINDLSEKDIVAKDIKKSIVFSFNFILLFITSIIAWFSLKKYRQYLFNLKTTNE